MKTRTLPLNLIVFLAPVIYTFDYRDNCSKKGKTKLVGEER